MKDLSLLRKLIREYLLNEADISEIDATGSTHRLQTCKIKGNKYFLKFTDPYDMDEQFHPSLQILAEYLAYRIYGLYEGVVIPSTELVYDKSNDEVGLATTPAEGRQGISGGIEAIKRVAKMLSPGVYVDILLANWDVIGTGRGNIFVSDKKATRMDPGGSTVWRATGPRKGSKFSTRAGELKTMLNAEYGGAGRVFQYADLKDAASTFKSIPWNRVEREIEAVRNEVNEQLQERGMRNLMSQWNSDIDTIESILSQRHIVILEHANLIK
jgi:hypothetical protein